MRRPTAEASRAPTMAMEGRLSKVTPSTHGDHGRRAVDGGEAGGIVGLASGEMEGAELCGGLEFALDLGCGRGGDAGLGAGFPGEIGKVRQHSCGRAVEAFKQMEEGDGADAACPREPQPVRPLSPVSKRRFIPDSPGGASEGSAGFFLPIFGSVPSRMRLMLAR